MIALPRLPDGSSAWPSALDRRAMLETCGVLVLALTGCGRALESAQLGRLVINDPPRDEFMPVLRALITAVLPFEHAAFPPVTPAAIEHRVLDLFPLDRDRDAANVRRGLMIFNATALFPVIGAPTTADERTASGDSSPELAGKAAHDRALHATWMLESGATGREEFVALAVEARRSYLRLWSQSGFIARRHFYQSAKRLVMVAAYSTADMWAAIGYAGPVLRGRP